MYIHTLKQWPNFYWNDNRLLNLLIKASFLQGELLGKMTHIGFELKQEAMLDNLTSEITKSSEIEGEILSLPQVRSSIARKLNIEQKDNIKSSHHIDGIVEMMIDATKNYANDLAEDRLFGWHASLFPTGYSGMYKINVAALRNDEHGPMQVVSNKNGKETIHFQAPAASSLGNEMAEFFAFINNDSTLNPLIKAGIAHLWFLTLHPFDDGNGRIARAITELMMAKADNSFYRFYSISTQIQADKKNYYLILEETQKGNLDITNWLEWFLQTVIKAIKHADILLEKTMNKAIKWQVYNNINLDDNQRKIINLLLDGFNGQLTTSKWAKICKCSNDTALRSIKYLVENKILSQQGNGRSTHYILQD